MDDRAEEGDGLITDRIGLGIGIRTADCVPILLLDSETRALGAVHAGWRGTAAGIAGGAVQRLAAVYGSQPKNLYAAIGPAIRVCCYQVSEDVALRFSSMPGATQPDGPGKFKLDLAAANRAQMEAAGLPGSHIFDSRLCTSCLNVLFHSYRRDRAETGRMVASICRTA